MNRSESIKELASALSKAQGMMGPAKKDSVNPFFKSVYSDLASVINAIRDPLSSNGLSYTQDPGVEDTGWVYVETTLMHESGEWKSSMLRMMPTKSDPQGIGSCITYIKRYSLQAILGVPSDDDDGNAATRTSSKKEEKPYDEKLLSKWTEYANSAPDADILKSVWINGSKEFKAAGDAQGAAQFRKLVTGIGETMKALAKEKAAEMHNDQASEFQKEIPEAEIQF